MKTVKNYLHGRIEICVGDITDLDVDVIVNAANSSLLGGGGVDGAIHRGAGPSVLAECKVLRQTQFPDGLPAGQAVMTGAGNLSVRYIIHTVGPIYNRQNPSMPELLRSCYVNSLEIAATQGCTTIAFPAISTGAYGYPKEEAAVIAAGAVTGFLEKNMVPDKVLFVFFKDMDAAIFMNHSGLSE